MAAVLLCFCWLIPVCRNLVRERENIASVVTFQPSSYTKMISNLYSIGNNDTYIEKNTSLTLHKIHMTEVLKVFSYIVYALFSHPIYVLSMPFNQSGQVVKLQKRKTLWSMKWKQWKAIENFWLKNTYCIWQLALVQIILLQFSFLQ